MSCSQRSPSRINLACAHTSYEPDLEQHSLTAPPLLPPQIDEMDYGRLMAAYSHLTPAAWQPTSLRRASPLVHHCLPDLRNAGERL